MANRSSLVVLATVVVNMTGVGLFWPILPQLVSELGGGTISQTAWAYGALTVVFALMQFLFAPVMGALSDRYGRRPVLLVALTGMGLDSLLIALAPSLLWVFIGRALGGVFGATISVANAYMSDISRASERAAAFGQVGAAFGIGFILGPLLGGVLGEIDTRLPAFAAAGLSFLNVIFGWFFLKESLPENSRRETPLFKSNVLSAFRFLAASAILLPLAAALMIATTMQRGLESIWVLFTGFQYGWGVREAGISLAVVGIGYVFVQGFLVKRVVAAVGEVSAIGYGFALSASMYLLLAFNTSGLVGYMGIIPHVIGWGIAIPALQSLASRHVGPDQQGMLQGALTSVSGLAAVAGPAIATASFAWLTGPFAPVVFPGAYFLGGSLLLFIAAIIGARSGRGARQ